MEREPPRDGGDFSDRHYKTNKGKGRAQTPPRPPSPEPEPEPAPLFDERTGASSSRYRPPLNPPSASSSGRNRPLSYASASALSCDHYMSVLPHLPMRWLMMMVSVSKSLAAVRAHPSWFQIAFLSFSVSFPLLDRRDNKHELSGELNFTDLRDLYLSYFTDMSAESCLFDHYGVDLLADWISQHLEMPPGPLRNLPFYLDVLRLGGFFFSFYSRQRLKAVVRTEMELVWRAFCVMVACNLFGPRVYNKLIKSILQKMIRCEFILRITDMFCITNCADNSIDWTATLMHNPRMPRVLGVPVLDIPESGVERLNELFEHVLRNPTLENLHLIFSRLNRGDDGLGRVLLHFVRRYSTSVQSFIGEGTMRGLFAHFHYSVTPHLGRIALGQNPIQYDFIIDDAGAMIPAIPPQLDATDRLSESDEDGIWRSAMIRCQQHPLWRAEARSIEFYLGEDWLRDAIEALRSEESSRRLEDAARATPPQSPGAAPDESDPRITPEDGE
jgi:hypothetical protein